MNRFNATYVPPSEDASSQVHKDTYRLICFLAGVVSPAFGVIYHLLDPSAVDPLWARFGLSVVTLGLLALSYLNEWVELHFIPLAQGLFYVLTAYFIGVTYLNDFAPNYALGALLSLSAIGVGFSLGSEQTRPLASYLTFATLACTVGVVILDTPEVNPYIMSISAFSVSLVIYAVARAKIQAEALAFSTEKRYQYVSTLINAATDAIFIINPDTGQFVEANQRAEALVGRPLDTLRSMHISDLYPADDRDHYATLFEQLIHEEDASTESLCIVDSEARQIPVDVSASLIGVDGQQFVQAIFRDATERHRYEQQLIEAKEHAEKLLKLKSSFLNNMSHELRTPLTSILGYAEVLHEEKAEELRAEFAERIVNSAKRLQGTLNSVLDLAQLESGEVSLNLKDVDISEEVEDVVTLLEPIADRKGLKLAVHTTSSEAYAEVDSACVNRITNNLVGNAIKFTDEGHVTVEVGTTEQSVFVRIEDTGIGIDEDFLSHLFDEFRQESSGLQRSHEGSGLGLAITKRLVDLLGGSIDVESKKGVGSTFTVYFPRACTSHASPSPSSAETESAPDALTFSGSILAVEDNPLTRELIAHQLGKQCDVDVVANPDEALALAQHQSFDVLVLDIHLSAGQNGVDLLHDLRALPDYDAVPAIALTAYALPADREQFLDEGFDYYLSKPFTKEELWTILQRATNSYSPLSS